ncbi:MAG TPA: DUF429 domain-containing protein [Actinokineospora sp.]|jgi:predicted RNase H-like nuclease|nr:DUF429 domain-containing protein [Actinokineospora sp.]
MRIDRVLGVDACKAGWIGVTLAGENTNAYFAENIRDLVAKVEANGTVAVIAVDMPIGLPDRGHREADTLARGVIGALRSSVFMTPTRAALDGVDHATASASNKKLTDKGISIQAFGLKPKLLEVDVWVRSADRRIIEVHPEVCFAALAGEPLTAGKKTWAGSEHRRRLLADAGIVLDGDLGEAGRRAAADDVLDAAVAAWTAARYLRGEATSLPEKPQVFSDGLKSAIWR